MEKSRSKSIEYSNTYLDNEQVVLLPVEERLVIVDYVGMVQLL